LQLHDNSSSGYTATLWGHPLSNPHNVFISWSGERSRIVAIALRDWLPRVVQAAKPWMSDSDIEKGSRGLSELTKALFSARVGISCVTPENANAAWLLFEAGALSKQIDDSAKLCTYLLDGLEPQDITAPLGMFQATTATMNDTRKLVRTINNAVADDPIRQEDLDAIFEAMWPSLEVQIKNLPRSDGTKAVKRKPEDMLAEILEIVRADTNRRRKLDSLEPYLPIMVEALPKVVELLRAMNSPSGTRPVQLIPLAPVLLTGIEEDVVKAQKFIAEIISHASRWDESDKEVFVTFPAKARALAEMLSGQKTLAKLTSIVSERLGRTVRVLVRLDPPERDI
jgi:hypothetical protein